MKITSTSRIRIVARADNGAGFLLFNFLLFYLFFVVHGVLLNTDLHYNIDDVKVQDGVVS